MGVAAFAGEQARQTFSNLTADERRRLLEAMWKSDIQIAIDESSDKVKDAYAKLSADERAQLLNCSAHDRLIALVIDVLKDQGWSECDHSQVQIEDRSGESGSNTYKVTAFGMKPESVAFHDRSMFADRRLSEQVMAAAGQHLEAHGLAPRRLAEACDWFIEVWEGERPQEFHLEQHVIEFGQLLGRLHSASTSWYDGWRKKLRDEHPCLHDVADGSHLWYYASLAEKIHEDCRPDVFDDYFRPVCPVAQRLAFAHGELSTVNMIRTSDGLKAIDFETACITIAAFDLATTLQGISDEWLWEACREGPAVNEKPKLKRAFLESYLKTLGEPAGVEDVENLLIDAELYFLAVPSSPVSPPAFLARGDQYTRLYTKRADWEAALAWWKDYVGRVRGGDVAAREELLIHGLSPVRDRFASEQLDTLSIKRCGNK